jgi:hypothetical protein
MTHEEYLKAIDTSMMAGGPGGPDWNTRFLDALAENGLRLVFKSPVPRVDGNDHMAPVPHPEGPQYQYPAWIVPGETTEQMQQTIKTLHDMAVKSGSIMSDEEVALNEESAKTMAACRASRRQRLIDDIAEAVVKKLSESNSIKP